MGVRLREGETLLEIVKYLLDSYPRGLRRSAIQDYLIARFNVGQSTGGVNRQLKRLRQADLIRWDQDSYTYALPVDAGSKDYFGRVVRVLGLSTDQAYFLSLEFKGVFSENTLLDVNDYIGARYEDEMGENSLALRGQYSDSEFRVYEMVRDIIRHHNSYVRFRLFKTVNESFLRDLSRLEPMPEARRLLDSYSNNLKSIESQIEGEMGCIFGLRESLIKCLKDKRVSRRIKFLIRFTLNHIRPSLVYDRMI
jgi:hypothetical protein